MFWNVYDYIIMILNQNDNEYEFLANVVYDYIIMILNQNINKK